MSIDAQNNEIRTGEDYISAWLERSDFSEADRIYRLRQQTLARLGLDLWTGSDEQVTLLREITLEQELEQR